MAANKNQTQKAAGRIPAGQAQKTLTSRLTLKLKNFVGRFSLSNISASSMRTAIKLLLLVMLVYLQSILWIGEGSFADVRRLKQSISELEQKNKSLQARNQQLIDEVESLRNGLDLIEHRAREDLGFIKEGEVFYHIIKKQPEKERNEQKK